jgi:transposase-like protein
MPNRPTSRELKQAYRRLGSVAAVAEELGVAYETARQWLRSAGVELRAKGRPSEHAPELDVKKLAARYRRGESIATLAESVGVSPNTVRNRLLAAGVTPRPRPGWRY